MDKDISIQRRCAWCGIDLDSGSSSKCWEIKDCRITHGICISCAESLIIQDGIKLQNFINMLKTPVMVVDSKARLVTANKEACLTVGEHISSSKGLMAGEVFQCIHAIVPGQCGNTIHCSGCAIRIAVTETYLTGNSMSDVPAFLKQQSAEEPQNFYFFISTLKVGDYVMIRIARMRHLSAHQIRKIIHRASPYKGGKRGLG